MQRIAFYFSFVLLFITPLLAGAQEAGTCACDIALDSTFQDVPMTKGPDQGVPPYYKNDNAVTPLMPLPFTFCFYGQSFDSVIISNNGIVCFSNAVFNFIKSGGFPLGADSMMIAPFYADISTLGLGGLVFYKMTPTAMIVKWLDVSYATQDIDSTNTFQLIMTDGNDPILPPGTNVSFCYLRMKWTTADSSGGFNGYGGIPAIVGVNKGDGNTFGQIGTFNVPGSTYYGPFEQYDGVNWLNGKSFSFNTCVSGNVIPPVILKEGTCDTITMCIGDMQPFTAIFLTPQQTQTCTLSATCDGMSGFSIIDTSTVYGLDSITVQLSPSAADVGTHTLTITATDNSIPPLTTTQSYVVVIPPCLGVNEVNSSNHFNVYPNPGNGNFTVELGGQSLMNSMASVYDVLGNTVYSEKLVNQKTEIDLSSSAKGVYFLKLTEEDGYNHIEKIIVQ